MSRARGVCAACETLDRFPPFAKMEKKGKGAGVSGGPPWRSLRQRLPCAHNALSPTWPGLLALLRLDSIPSAD